MHGSLGSMSGLLQNGLSPTGLGMGLPSGLTGGKPHGLGSHDGGSSENLLSSESGEGQQQPCCCCGDLRICKQSLAWRGRGWLAQRYLLAPTRSCCPCKPVLPCPLIR